MARELNFGWAIGIDLSHLGGFVWWTGTGKEFQLGPELAVVYTTEDIAKKSARLIYAKLKKDHPNHRRPVVVKFPMYSGPVVTVT